jgi:hypothetical protein
LGERKGLIFETSKAQNPKRILIVDREEDFRTVDLVEEVKESKRENSD